MEYLLKKLNVSTNIERYNKVLLALRIKNEIVSDKVEKIKKEATNSNLRLLSFVTSSSIAAVKLAASASRENIYGEIYTIDTKDIKTSIVSKDIDILSSKLSVSIVYEDNIFAGSILFSGDNINIREGLSKGKNPKRVILSIDESNWNSLEFSTDKKTKVIASYAKDKEIILDSSDTLFKINNTRREKVQITIDFSSYQINNFSLITLYNFTLQLKELEKINHKETIKIAKTGKYIGVEYCGSGEISFNALLNGSILKKLSGELTHIIGPEDVTPVVLQCTSKRISSSISSIFYAGQDLSLYDGRIEVFSGLSEYRTTNNGIEYRETFSISKEEFSIDIGAKSIILNGNKKTGSFIVHSGINHFMIPISDFPLLHSRTKDSRVEYTDGNLKVYTEGNIQEYTIPNYIYGEIESNSINFYSDKSIPTIEGETITLNGNVNSIFMYLYGNPVYISEIEIRIESSDSTPKIFAAGIKIS